MNKSMFVNWAVTLCVLVGTYQRLEKHTASIFRVNDETAPKR
jgi:hypothetical protein